MNQGHERSSRRLSEGRSGNIKPYSPIVWFGWNYCTFCRLSDHRFLAIHSESFVCLRFTMGNLRNKECFLWTNKRRGRRKNERKERTLCFMLQITSAVVQIHEMTNRLICLVFVKRLTQVIVFHSVFQECLCTVTIGNSYSLDKKQKKKKIPDTNRDTFLELQELFASFYSSAACFELNHSVLVFSVVVELTCI